MSFGHELPLQELSFGLKLPLQELSFGHELPLQELQFSHVLLQQELLFSMDSKKAVVWSRFLRSCPLPMNCLVLSFV